MTNKILLLALVFIVCAGIGFLIPKAFFNNVPSSTGKETEVKEELPPPVEEVLSVIEVSDPVFDETTKKYTFTATASSNARMFYLADSSRQPIHGYAQQSGTFEVPPANDGIYYVFVVDASGHESEYVEVSGCKPEGRIIPEKDRIKKDEFQKLLMGKDPKAATKALQGRITSSVRYQFLNLDPEADEKGMEPRHYTGIITNLQIGHWKSVTVSSVGYNNAGQLNQARISVEY